MLPAKSDSDASSALEDLEVLYDYITDDDAAKEGQHVTASTHSNTSSQPTSPSVPPSQSKRQKLIAQYEWLKPTIFHLCCPTFVDMLDQPTFDDASLLIGTRQGRVDKESSFTENLLVRRARSLLGTFKSLFTGLTMHCAAGTVNDAFEELVGYDRSILKHCFAYFGGLDVRTDISDVWYHKSGSPVMSRHPLLLELRGRKELFEGYKTHWMCFCEKGKNAAKRQARLRRRRLYAASNRKSKSGDESGEGEGDGDDDDDDDE
ncbi:hypothetical protein SeMB42_g04612 [Synchytrium endobioticum]|nr:hypothetical protein SeMB42_g04612 [Synchytrium endobioticum]